MGHYTTLKFKATIRKDSEVFYILDRIINKKEDFEQIPIEHPFGKCERWHSFFFGKNCEDYQDPTFNKHGHLTIHSEYKNYDGEVYKFIDWVAPQIVTAKGKYKVEDMDHWIPIEFDDKSLEFNKLLMAR